MHVVSIFNNKGGVGKSTLTVCLAEMLAGNRKKRVLVLDLDAQDSSSRALLHPNGLDAAIRDKKTIGYIARNLLNGSRRAFDVHEFISIRPGCRDTKASPLEQLAVIAHGSQEHEGLDGTIKESDAASFGDLFRDALEKARFEYVLIDMPGSVDRRSTAVVSGLVMSDVVLVPIEPTDIALWGLERTFALIAHANALRQTNRRRTAPALAMVWNKADRRTRGGKDLMNRLEVQANEKNLPPIFKQHLSIAPPLTIATDATHPFRTLKEKFGTATYYDNVRHVTNELVGLCEGGNAAPSVSWFKRLGGVVGRVLGGQTP